MCINDFMEHGGREANPPPNAKMSIFVIVKARSKYSRSKRYNRRNIPATTTMSLINEYEILWATLIPVERDTDIFSRINMRPKSPEKKNNNDRTYTYKE